MNSLPRYYWSDSDFFVEYAYRQAVQADVLGADYQVTENDIILLSVGGESSICYTIPDRIQGKKVVALVVPGCECLYLPKSVVAIHGTQPIDEFEREVGYLYFPGEILAIEDNCEPLEWSNIYTSETCQDQYGNKFSETYRGRWFKWSSQTYLYRTATAEDVADENYQNTDGDIVITDISCPIPGGVYDIPAYIDGKKVVAIGKNAFSGGYLNTRIVYVPATVKAIAWQAFAGCLYLTDVYFRCETVWIGYKVFGFYGNTTLHCSATCRSQDGYFKDLTESYDVTWKEWNG